MAEHRRIVLRFRLPDGLTTVPATPTLATPGRQFDPRRNIMIAGDKFRMPLISAYRASRLAFWQSAVWDRNDHQCAELRILSASLEATSVGIPSPTLQHLFGIKRCVVLSSNQYFAESFVGGNSISMGTG